MTLEISKQHTNLVAVQPLTTFPKEDRMKTQSHPSSPFKRSLLAASLWLAMGGSLRNLR